MLIASASNRRAVTLAGARLRRRRARRRPDARSPCRCSPRSARTSRASRRTAAARRRGRARPARAARPARRARATHASSTATARPAARSARRRQPDRRDGCSAATGRASSCSRRTRSPIPTIPTASSPGRSCASTSTPNGAVTGARCSTGRPTTRRSLACDGFSAARGRARVPVRVPHRSTTPTTARATSATPSSPSTRTPATPAPCRASRGSTRRPASASATSATPWTQLVVAADGVRKYAGFDTERALADRADARLLHAGRARPLPGRIPTAASRSRSAATAARRARSALYRLTESQVEHGALPVSTLAPCATFTVPNNTSADEPVHDARDDDRARPRGVGRRSRRPRHVLLAARDARPSTCCRPPATCEGTVAFSLPSATTDVQPRGLGEPAGDGSLSVSRRRLARPPDRRARKY